MSKRTQIVKALVEKVKYIDGSSTYNSNLYNNVFNKLKFWDEVNDFPSVFINTGPETRQYLPGGFKWAHLTVNIRIYVNEENPEEILEDIFADIEKIIDANGNMVYDSISGSKIEDMEITTINTDEGLLAPIGVGEIALHIMYDLES